MQVDIGLDVVAVGESAELLFDHQAGSAAIPPTPLNNERIPNQDLILIRTLSALEAPCQQFLVRASLKRPGGQLVVVHFPEPAKAGIETRGIGKSQMITIRQEALGVQAILANMREKKLIPDVST